MIIPVVTQVSTTETIYTGSHQEFEGTVTKEVTNYVATTATKVTGYTQVESGSQYDELNVSLVQIGYVNAGGNIRTYFIQGPNGDYVNANVKVNGVGLSSAVSLTTPFQSLDASDQNLVLEYLGYKPLYQLESSSGTFYHIEDGTTTTTAFDPNSVWNAVPSNSSVTFAQHSTGDTITLNNGTSWSSLGFAVGQYLHISNTTNNNTASNDSNLYTVAGMTGDVLTLSVSSGVTNETDSAPYIYYETIQSGPSTATDLSGKEILMSSLAVPYLAQDSSTGPTVFGPAVQVASYSGHALRSITTRRV